MKIETNSRTVEILARNEDRVLYNCTFKDDGSTKKFLCRPRKSFDKAFGLN